jgi:hypothetical protein
MGGEDRGVSRLEIGQAICREAVYRKQTASLQKPRHAFYSFLMKKWP